MAFRLLNQSIVTFQIEKCTPIRQLVMWMVFALAKVPSTHSFIHSFIRPLSHCKLSSSSPSPSHAIPIQRVHRVQTCLMQFVCACSFVPEWSLVHSLLGHPHPIHPSTHPPSTVRSTTSVMLLLLMLLRVVYLCLSLCGYVLYT